MMNPINPDFLRMTLECPNETQPKPLAMAFIQNQTLLDVMDVDDGFNAGTIFNDLNKPFMPWGDR